MLPKLEVQPVQRCIIIRLSFFCKTFVSLKQHHLQQQQLKMLAVQHLIFCSLLTAKDSVAVF